MTNIKCSYDCKFQTGGFCNYQTIKRKELSKQNTDCIYYEKKHTD
ncbi:MAG: hypothetical protein ACI4VN_02970 [Clostridia bacterium]